MLLIVRLLLLTVPLLFFWQVLLPVLRDRPVFPLLRRSPKRLREAKRKVVDAEINAEAAGLEARATEINVATAETEVRGWDAVDSSFPETKKDS